MEQNTPSEVERRLHERTREEAGERRITCADALDLAAELEISPAVIGELCDRHGIKVRRCQLNCF